MKKKFERIVTLSPAFDKRDPNPNKDYGIHGVELRMVLKGPLGATQFILYTNWQLPHVTREMIIKTSSADPITLKARFLPLPADKGYHWKKRRYKGQHSYACDLLPGKKCYYDGSGLNANALYEVLLKEGSDGVWRDLENYYNELAKEKP